MDAGIEYSKRLGVIKSYQFQAALKKFDLGDFVCAMPLQSGLFGQNVIVKSTKGKFVLRGKPHYPWQFPKEKYGAELLHNNTKVPVPYPYLHDFDTDIFGWDYILMPYMPGIHPENNHLSFREKLDIASALGNGLAELHKCKWDFCGEYDLATDTIKSFEAGYAKWFVSDVECWLAALNEHAGISVYDADWVRKYLCENIKYLMYNIRPCFVMNDYNPYNVLVENMHGKWVVSGVFDLMEYYFGDGSADLVRMIAHYLEKYSSDAYNLINAFIKGYFTMVEMEPCIIDKFKLFMLRDRLIIWEYGTRPNVAWFNNNDSFREYVKRYMDNYELLKGFN